MLFVYSHFLIFYEEIFIHKKGKSKALTANLALSQSSFKFWVCINNSSFFLMYKISMLYQGVLQLNALPCDYLDLNYMNSVIPHKPIGLQHCYYFDIIFSLKQLLNILLISLPTYFWTSDCFRQFLLHYNNVTQNFRRNRVTPQSCTRYCI